MIALGIAAHGETSSVVLLRDGEILCTARESDLTLQSQDANWPEHAITACLEHCGLTAADIDGAGFFEEPHARFSRVLATSLSAPFPGNCGSFVGAMKEWVGERLWMRAKISSKLGLHPDSVFMWDHHCCHWAAAWAHGGERADVLVLDHNTSWSTSSCFRAGPWAEGPPEPLYTSPPPSSLGAAMIALAHWAGLPSTGAMEFLQQLASHGQPKHTGIFEAMFPSGPAGLDLAPGYLELKSMDQPDGQISISPGLRNLIGPPRDQREAWQVQGANAPDKRFADTAASLVSVITERASELAARLRSSSGSKHLTLAGPVGGIRAIAVQAAQSTGYSSVRMAWPTGDPAAALGASLLTAQALGWADVPTLPDSPYTGLDFDSGPCLEMAQHLNPRSWSPFSLATKTTRASRLRVQTMGIPAEPCGVAAERLIAGAPVGWLEGRLSCINGARADRVLLTLPGTTAHQSPQQLRGGLSIERPWVIVLEEDADALCRGFLDQPPDRLWGSHPVLIEPSFRQWLGTAVRSDGRAQLIVCSPASQPRLAALLGAIKRTHTLGALLGSPLSEAGQPTSSKPVDALMFMARTDLQDLFIDPSYIRQELQ